MGIKRGCALETYYLSPITYYIIILSHPRIPNSFQFSVSFYRTTVTLPVSNCGLSPAALYSIRHTYVPVGQPLPSQP